jgi:hypothetical protein
MRYYLKYDNKEGHIDIGASSDNGSALLSKQTLGICIHMSKNPLRPGFLKADNFKEITQQEFTQIYYQLCGDTMLFARDLDALISQEIESGEYKLHFSPLDKNSQTIEFFPNENNRS